VCISITTTTTTTNAAAAAVSQQHHLHLLYRCCCCCKARRHSVLRHQLHTATAGAAVNVCSALQDWHCSRAGPNSQFAAACCSLVLRHQLCTAPGAAAVQHARLKLPCRCCCCTT
jgi:hypothetical protein